MRIRVTRLLQCDLNRDHQQGAFVAGGGVEGGSAKLSRSTRLI
jgi:hypothetical protein